MTQTMDEFEKLLNEQFSYTFNVADIIQGVVVKRDKNGFLVDIGAKSEAYLPDKEITANGDKPSDDVLKIGDLKDFYVLKGEDEDDEGIITLSLKRISCAKAWQDLATAKLSQEPIMAKVVQVVKGGVIVEINELRGFIPASQLRIGTPLDSLIGTEIETRVLEADAKRNKLILSQRQAIAEQREQLVDDVIASLSVDQVVKGEIIRIAEFGAFIDINGVDGLLPISEISWARIKHPSDVLTLGETIEVKILKIDYDLKRISLSLKRMGDNPWEEIEGKFEEGQIVKGTVNKVAAFGVFVNIFPGVEALLPTSEMKDENQNPFNVFKVGDEISVMIKKFTPQEHRIALSMKEV
ncbi:S1 RNA-binding domain-containing protein [bacterium]|nr:S1 RNA-binding domain-containing protein [bacterium]